MAKVMISLPDELLAHVDAEVQRRQTSRSALLQDAARHEIGLLRREHSAITAELDQLSRMWRGPLDAAALVRHDRRRNG